MYFTLYGYNTVLQARGLIRDLKMVFRLYDSYSCSHAWAVSLGSIHKVAPSRDIHRTISGRRCGTSYTHTPSSRCILPLLMPFIGRPLELHHHESTYFRSPYDPPRRPGIQCREYLPIWYQRVFASADIYSNDSSGQVSRSKYVFFYALSTRLILYLPADLQQWCSLLGCPWEHFVCTWRSLCSKFRWYPCNIVRF